VIQIVHFASGSGIAGLHLMYTCIVLDEERKDDDDNVG
jgi:hypothetical protein